MPRKKEVSKRKLLNLQVKDFIKDFAIRIDLDADYQREKVWSTDQQKRLLDSLLRDIDIPKLYIVEVPDNAQFDFECVDGKQRMNTLLRFFKPEVDEKKPLTIRHYEKELTYQQFKKSFPDDARLIENYELTFVLYKPLDDELVREIFRRLQLGIRLNSGELLKTRTGAIRDFIYKEIGNDGPFFRFTDLSERRFSRPFTLAQICINSFERAKPDSEFVRARLQDIEDFFNDNAELDKNDSKLERIRKVLIQLDKSFQEKAKIISSRAVAVTAYLFVEEITKGGASQLPIQFVKFYLDLLDTIKRDMELISNYEKPQNSLLLEEFQKYVTQASVEANSIKRRHIFVSKAFDYFMNSKTKGRIIGSK